MVVGVVVFDCVCGEDVFFVLIVGYVDMFGFVVLFGFFIVYVIGNFILIGLGFVGVG